MLATWSVYIYIFADFGVIAQIENISKPQIDVFVACAGPLYIHAACVAFGDPDR
jgi:hypothetical protein